MNYGQIRTQFKALLNRSDCTDALADTFISQGIARSERILRLKDQEKTYTQTISPSVTTVTFPSDLVEVISLDVDGEYVTYLPTQRYLELSYTFAGKPKYWTRIGNTVKLKPSPSADQVFTLYYYSKFDTFTDDSTETTMSANAPELFIYGGLSFAADYFIDERKDAFEQRYQAAAMELQSQSATYDGSVTIQPAYSFGDY